MKKKILISIIVFLVVMIILMLILTNSYIDGNIQLTQVLYGSISPEYSFLASVQGEEHYQFFSGTIKELYYLPQDKINKNDTVLDYYDAYDKVKNLKANYNGFLLEFSNDYIKIEESDYYLVADVKQEIYEKVEIGNAAVYQYDDNFYPCELIEKNDNGFEKDGQIFYSLKFKTFDDILLPKQNTVIKITAGKLSGLIVDKNALLQINGETYLLSEAYISDYSHIEKYKIPVEVVYCTQDKALISGIDLEHKNVCILDENLRRVLEND